MKSYQNVDNTSVVALHDFALYCSVKCAKSNGVTSDLRKRTAKELGLAEDEINDGNGNDMWMCPGCGELFYIEKGVKPPKE